MDIRDYIKTTFTDSDTVYFQGGVSFKICQTEPWNTFECTTPRDRPAFYVTGHRDWSHCDRNLTCLNNHLPDYGKALAKQAYFEDTGKRATFCEPVYVYQHGSVAYQRSQTCDWDSRFIGWICFNKGEYRAAIKGKTPDYDRIMDQILQGFTDEINGHAYCVEWQTNNPYLNSGSFHPSVFRSESFDGSDWETSGLYHWFEDEMSMLVRVYADDHTLEPRAIMRDYGRTFSRTLSAHDTKLGHLMKAYLLREDEINAHSAQYERLQHLRP